MKMTTTYPQSSAIATATAKNQTVHNRVETPVAGFPNRVVTPAPTAEEQLISRIFRESSGKALMKFCRELTLVLIRRYSIDEDAADLRDSLCDSLEATLKCTRAQANSLIDLSLEMIHAKVRGKYRRTDLEISYLIATATGAVSDISSN